MVIRKQVDTLARTLAFGLCHWRWPPSVPMSLLACLLPVCPFYFSIRCLYIMPSAIPSAVCLSVRAASSVYA